MHAILTEVAESDEFAMRSSAEFSHRPPAPERERRVFVLQSVVRLLATLATFEDKSRKFVAGLIEEHRRG